MFFCYTFEMKKKEQRKKKGFKSLIVYVHCDVLCDAQVSGAHI